MVNSRDLALPVIGPKAWPALALGTVLTAALAFHAARGTDEHSVPQVVILEQGQAGPETIVPRWELLGSPGPARLQALAAAPGWPEDRLLLAAREPSGGRTGFVRSPDGGRTWQQLPPAAFALAGGWSPQDVLRLARAPGGAFVAFADTGAALYRSPDAGASWREVVNARSQAGLAGLVLSPAFAEDGLAYVTRGGAAWRSTDGGATWQAFDPEPGQLVQQVAFSPAFARDRTLFVAVISGPFRSRLPPPRFDQPPTDHADSRGVLVSRDGGASWEPAAEGLEVAGVPFRHVQALAISPTYADDGILLAFALGPWPPSPSWRLGGYGSVRAALFRSQDGARSWEPVFDAGAHNTVYAHLAVSPALAEDGVGLFALNTSEGSPGSSGCRVLRSEDAGATWYTVMRPGLYEGCMWARVLAVGGENIPVVQRGNHPAQWRMSVDDGRSWFGGSPPGESPSTFPAVLHSGDVLFAGTERGNVWAFGAFGPCPVEPVLGFGRVWRENRQLRTALGCALGPERSVSILEKSEPAPRPGGPLSYRTYWPDDAAEPYYARLWPDGSLGWQAKAREPWDRQGAEAAVGAIQRFAGGTMLWVPGDDESLILVHSLWATTGPNLFR